jgi:hypothetical protein
VAQQANSGLVCLIVEIYRSHTTTTTKTTATTTTTKQQQQQQNNKTTTTTTTGNITVKMSNLYSESYIS